MSQIILRCPACGLTVHAPADKELPEDGPVCAMGHPETPMVVATSTVGQG